MVLSLTRFVEAFLIAAMLILLTNPHLIPALTQGEHTAGFFHLF